MRALVPALAAAFAAGAWLGDRFHAAASVAFAVALAGSVVAVLMHRRRRACAGVACATALAAGAAMLGQRVAEALPSLDAPALDAVIEGRVARSEPQVAGTRLELRGVAWVEPARAGPARIELRFEAGEPTPPIGATIRAAIRTRRIVQGAANPGGFDAARRLAREGLGASVRAIDPLLVEVVEAPSLNLSTSLANRRLAAIALLRGHGRGGALLAALGLGDQAGLPERDRRAWAALGIAHLLSVSGLHLALAAAAAYALAAGVLARAACARFDARRVALSVALAAAALYAVLAGLATPALRSLAMLACLAAAVALRRPASSAHALASAALIVLALDPAALFAPGAQLSFAATAAIVLAHRTQPGAGRLRRALGATLSTTALATLGTAPIAALHFGVAPPLAGAANLIAVPLTAVLGMPLAFAASACALLAPSATPTLLFASAARLAAAGLDGALSLANAAPSVAPHPPHVAALALCTALAALGLRTPRLGVRLACAFVAQGALALAPAPALLPTTPRLVFLDVGHGDATLVQVDGFGLLVDAGGASPDGWDAGARVVVPALAALGVRRLDALAITHADLDHRGGAGAVLGAFRCDELWLPHGAARDAAFATLIAQARARGARIRELGAGAPVVAREGVRVTALWPPARGEALGDNDRSLVLRIELAGVRALLLGDLEAHGEMALVASGESLRADVVKLAHHGSRSSSTAALLDAAQPRLAVISAPLRGRFGWPHTEVLARLEERGIALAWTGRDGALFAGAGARPCVRRWRHGDACAPLVAPGARAFSRAGPERSARPSLPCMRCALLISAREIRR